MAAKKKRFASPPEDKDGNILPLKKTALVRLRNKFRAATGITYEPSRFGVSIPAGTILPRSAEIVDDDYRGADMDLVHSVPPASRPSTLPEAEAKTSLTLDVAETKEEEAKIKEQQKTGEKLKLGA